MKVTYRMTSWRMQTKLTGQTGYRIQCQTLWIAIVMFETFLLPLVSAAQKYKAYRGVHMVTSSLLIYEDVSRLECVERCHDNQFCYGVNYKQVHPSLCTMLDQVAVITGVKTPSVDYLFVESIKPVVSLNIYRTNT